MTDTLTAEKPRYSPYEAQFGRPSSYTHETAQEIIRRLEEGEGLATICRDEDKPTRATVYKWLRERPDFLNMYERARISQADSLFDDVLHISDEDEDPRRAKVRIDARIWAAGRLRPKKYGDTKHVSVDHTLTLSDDQLDARLKALSKEAGLTLDGTCEDVTDAVLIEDKTG